MRAGSVLVKGPPAPDGSCSAPGSASSPTPSAPRYRRPRAQRRRPRLRPPAPIVPEAKAASAAPPRPRDLAPTWRASVGDLAGVIAEAEARGLDVAVAVELASDLAALADAAPSGPRRPRQASADRRARALPQIGRGAIGRVPSSAAWRGGGPRRRRSLLPVATSPSLRAARSWPRRWVARCRARASAGRDVARPTAEEYRRRHPDGPYAAAAAEILDEP